MLQSWQDVSARAQIISSVTLVKIIAPYVCIYGKKESFCNVHLCKVSKVFHLYLCSFDAFNNTEWGIAGNIFSFDEIFLCCNVSCCEPRTARTRLSFRRLILLGSLMTAAIVTARGKHTKSETSHLKTHPEQWEKGVGEFTN